MLTLRRAPSLVTQAPGLDDEQAAVVAHRASGHGSTATRPRGSRAIRYQDAGVLRVLGAPGTGKTTTAIEVVVDRVHKDGIAPDQCLVLTASMTAAADLRERITARIGGTST